MNVMLENYNNLLFVGKNTLLVEFLIYFLYLPMYVYVISLKVLNSPGIREILVTNITFLLHFSTFFLPFFLLHFSTTFWRGTSVIFSVIPPNLFSTFNQNFWVPKKNEYSEQGNILPHTINGTFKFYYCIKVFTYLWTLKMEKDLNRERTVGLRILLFTIDFFTCGLCLVLTEHGLCIVSSKLMWIT